MKINLMTLGATTLLGLLLMACSGGASAAPAPTATTAKPTAVPVTIELGSRGEEMSYDKASFEVPAGARVTLRFTNRSAALPHNWVLTKPGAADDVAAAGQAAGEANNYLAKTDSRVLASMPLVKPKQTGEIVFVAPTQAGTYPYICTFPGHVAQMRGNMIVK